jgi:hypothetical protein
MVALLFFCCNPIQARLMPVGAEQAASAFNGYIGFRTSIYLNKQYTGDEVLCLQGLSPVGRY